MFTFYPFFLLVFVSFVNKERIYSSYALCALVGAFKVSFYKIWSLLTDFCVILNIVCFALLLIICAFFTKTTTMTSLSRIHVFFYMSNSILGFNVRVARKLTFSRLKVAKELLSNFQNFNSPTTVIGLA